LRVLIRRVGFVRGDEACDDFSDSCDDFSDSCDDLLLDDEIVHPFNTFNPQLLVVGKVKEAHKHD
jgi:hypothetical protein